MSVSRSGTEFHYIFVFEPGSLTLGINVCGDYQQAVRVMREHVFTYQDQEVSGALKS